MATEGGAVMEPSLRFRDRAIVRQGVYERDRRNEAKEGAIEIGWVGVSPCIGSMHAVYLH